MNFSVTVALVFMAQSPLPRPVATLTVTTGNVKIERKVGAPPIASQKQIRLRNGDKVIIVEKGRMTVILDKSGATWRLPDKGQFEATEGALQGLNGAKAVLVQQGRTVARRPLVPSTVVTDKIRAGQVSIEPFGGIEQGPVIVRWTKVPGAGKTTVEILDSKDKSLWKFAAPNGATQVTLPAGAPKPGTWARIRVSQPEATSTWVYVLTKQEQTEVSAAERDLRTTLKEDPQALGLALGNLWAEFRLASKLPLALKMAFDDLESSDAQWRTGEWLEQAGFPSLARTAYEAAWKAGERDGLLKESIERLGGKADVPQWEAAAGERDLLMAAGKLKEALPLGQEVVGLLRKAKPGSLQLGQALTSAGEIHERLGHLDEADLVLGEALAVLERIAGPGSLEVAKSLLNLGIVAHSRGDLNLAQTRFEAALAIQQNLAPGSLDVAKVLNNLGALAYSRGAMDLAQKRFEAVLVIFEKLTPGSLDSAKILNNLGALALNRGDLDLALERFEAALAIREKVAPGSLDVAMSLNNLGVVALNRGDLDLAQTQFEAALAIRKKLAPGSLDVADSLNNLGTVASDRGDLDLAQTQFEAALAIREKVNPDSLDVAMILNNLGNVASDRGDLDLAQTQYEAALAIREKLAPGSLVVAHSLNNLGNVASDRGDLDLAQTQYEAALAIREKLAPGSLDVAHSLNNLGNVASDRGDLDLAQTRYEAALAIREKLAPGSLDVAMILNNLGNVASDRADLGLAQKRYEAALAVYEKLAPGSLDVAHSLNNLGTVASDRRDLDLAQAQYEAALAIREKLAPGSLDVANSLNNLGTVASDRRDLDLAQKRYEAALAIREKLAPGSLDLAASLNNLGIVAQNRGDLNLAQKRYEAALAIREKLAPVSLAVADSLQNLGSLARAQKDEAKLMDLQRRRLQIVTRLLESQGGKPGSLWTAATEALMRLELSADPSALYGYLPALRGAGLTLQSRYRASQRLAEADPAVQSAVSAVQVASKRETDWVTNPRPKDMDERGWNDQLQELRAKHQSAELALSRLLKERDPRLGQDTLKVELNQVQEGLPAGHMLVEFLRIATWDDKTNTFGADGYGAFLVGKDGPVRFVRLDAAEQIDKLVEVWQEQMSLATDPEAGEATLKSTEKELKSVGRKLYDALIKPLGKLPASLLIAPDSTLNGLSFGALVDATGKYLVESKVMSLVGSGRDLVEKPIAGTPGPAAVIAAPDFSLGLADVIASNAGIKSGTSVMRSFNSNGTWPSLDGALKEGRVIAGKLGVSPIEGAKATEERLMSLVRPGVLHIATHGNFDPPTVAATDREDLRKSGMIGSNLRVADNPMIRSALILAGANNEAALRKEGLQDGWATALELSQMDLRGTELVVLSACNTAKGDVRGADGVFGLQRAFRFAGAQTLVMSLFKVPDTSTLELMSKFYGAWKPGGARGTKLTALRGAQLAMLKDPKTRHPRNWSAFVLMGQR